MTCKVLKPEAIGGGGATAWLTLSWSPSGPESKHPRMSGRAERVPPPLKTNTMWEQEGKTVSLATTHPFNTTLSPWSSLGMRMTSRGMLP